MPQKLKQSGRRQQNKHLYVRIKCLNRCIFHRAARPKRRPLVFWNLCAPVVSMTEKATVSKLYDLFVFLRSD